MSGSASESASSYFSSSVTEGAVMAGYVFDYQSISGRAKVKYQKVIERSRSMDVKATQMRAHHCSLRRLE